jgi:hypothetical protein
MAAVKTGSGNRLLGCELARPSPAAVGCCSLLLDEGPVDASHPVRSMMPELSMNDGFSCSSSDDELLVSSITSIFFTTGSVSPSLLAFC